MNPETNSYKVGIDINIWNFIGAMFDIDVDASLGYQIPLFNKTPYYGVQGNVDLRLGGSAKVSVFFLTYRLTVWFEAYIADAILQAMIEQDVVTYQHTCWGLNYLINTFTASIRARLEGNECQQGLLGMFLLWQGFPGTCVHNQYDIDIIDQTFLEAQAPVISGDILTLAGVMNCYAYF